MIWITKLTYGGDRSICHKLNDHVHQNFNLQWLQQIVDGIRGYVEWELCCCISLEHLYAVWKRQYNWITKGDLLQRIEGRINRCLPSKEVSLRLLRSYTKRQNFKEFVDQLSITKEGALIYVLNWGAVISTKPPELRNVEPGISYKYCALRKERIILPLKSQIYLAIDTLC